MNSTQIWMLYMQQVPWKNHQKWSKKHHTEQTPYSLSSTLSKRISKSKHQSNIYRADRKIRMENVTERCIVRFQFELCIGSAYMQENRSPTRSRPPCTKLKKWKKKYSFSFKKNHHWDIKCHIIPKIALFYWY